MRWISSSLTTASIRVTELEAALAAERIRGCAGLAAGGDSGGDDLLAFLQAIEHLGEGSVGDTQFDGRGLEFGRAGGGPRDGVERPDDRGVGIAAAAKAAG